MRFLAKPKVFCIGRNKSGTTSLAAALRDLGYKVGNQPKAELMLEEWARRDFHRLTRLCKTADAFQDIPFSLDYTYVAMDQAFPGSKFILTVRNSADEWYESLTRFHGKIFGSSGGNLPPTVDELKAATYRAPGWVWRVHQLVFGSDETSVYDPVRYKHHYDSHTKQVLDYFRHRPEDLLVVNLSDADAMPRLCRFLGKPVTAVEMPHLNRSAGP